MATNNRIPYQRQHTNILFWILVIALSIVLSIRAHTNKETILVALVLGAIGTIGAIWVLFKEYSEWDIRHNPLRMAVMYAQNGSERQPYQWSGHELTIPSIGEQVIGLQLEARQRQELRHIQVKLVRGNKRKITQGGIHHIFPIRNTINFLKGCLPYSRPRGIFNLPTNSAIDMTNLSIGSIKADPSSRDRNSGYFGYCDIEVTQVLCPRMVGIDTWEVETNLPDPAFLSLVATHSTWLILTIKAKEPNKSWSGALEFWDKDSEYGKRLWKRIKIEAGKHGSM